MRQSLPAFTHRSREHVTLIGVGSERACYSPETHEIGVTRKEPAYSPHPHHMTMNREKIGPIWSVERSLDVCGSLAMA